MSLMHAHDSNNVMDPVIDSFIECNDLGSGLILQPNHYVFVMVWLPDGGGYHELQQAANRPNAMVWAAKVLVQASTSNTEPHVTHTAIVKELNSNDDFHPTGLDEGRRQIQQGPISNPGALLSLRHTWTCHNTGLSHAAAVDLGCPAPLLHLMQQHLDPQQLPILLTEHSVVFFFNTINLHPASEFSRQIGRSRLQIQERSWLTSNLQATTYSAILSTLGTNATVPGVSMSDDDDDDESIIRGG